MVMMIMMSMMMLMMTTMMLIMMMMMTMMIMTMMMTTMMVITLMMEAAHLRKGSSLITFTLATPATVTGTPCFSFLLKIVKKAEIIFDQDNQTDQNWSSPDWS